MAEWPETSLAEVARITSGKRPNIVSNTPSASCSVPIIGGGGPSGFTDAALFDPGVLITGRVGTLGKLFVASEPCWPSDNALVVRPNQDCIYPHYLRYALQNVIGEAAGMNRGAANPLITQKDRLLDAANGFRVALRPGCTAGWSPS
ncbi:restriction endonuclease subunit S [Rhodovibrio sodomensis]|uniref:restriction endonuclease subunit S n=1 Tax=Rhodovibrio sodomensis TaxID=1088 RepID=UPI001906AD91